jgi:hypothetical protein
MSTHTKISRRQRARIGVENSSMHEITEVAKNGRRPPHLDAEDVNKGE